METKKLSQSTLELIYDFTHLTFGNNTVTTPYFNNRHMQVRGALRVNVGKGNPQEIKEELKILSLREKIDLREFTPEQITKFMVDNHIGVDCSGLAYYILDAELKAHGKGSLKKNLKFPFTKNPLRKLLTKLRPVENCGVSTLAHDTNGVSVDIEDVQPGDMIVLLNGGPRKDYNHVMTVQRTGNNEQGTASVDYIHSFKYPSDGQYNHGVREESIEITHPNSSLLEQRWNEEKMREYAKSAEKIEIRRLKAMM
ncbi:MAG: hypothetical protein WCW16_00475 [Candidatus Magasanikbacteria bacterium]